MTPQHLLRQLRLFFALPLSFLPGLAAAETLYAPQLCPSRLVELKVVNFGTESSAFWLQVRERESAAERAVEDRHEIEGGESHTYKGIEFLPDGASFAVRSHDPNLRFYLSCAGLTPMTSVTSPRVEYPVKSLQSYHLRWQNLHRGSQNLHVQYFSRDGRTLHDLNIPGGSFWSHQQVDLLAPEGATSVVIEATGRLNTALLNSDSGRVLSPVLGVPLKVSTDPNAVYFLAADQANRESFSFALTDPALIAKARAALSKQRSMIVIARIEGVDSPGANRNFSSPDRSPWSWHVAEVFDFAELAHISCDGSPSLIEDYLPQWLGPGGGGICLWGYHLKRELTREEVRTGNP